MKKTFIITISLIFLAAVVFDAHGFMMGGKTTLGGRVPTPRLISPTGETVDLKGKSSLKFEWSPFEGDRTRRKYYDFRLYKGTEMLESTLILKKQVDSSICVIEIGADLFENDGTYTWSLRQVYDIEGKSLRGTQIFKVIK